MELYGPHTQTTEKEVDAKKSLFHLKPSIVEFTRLLREQRELKIPQESVLCLSEEAEAVPAESEVNSMMRS